MQEQWGLTIRDGFGQTETTARSPTRPGQPVKSGSMGRPLPGVPGRARRPGTGRAVDGRTRARSAWTSRGPPLTLMTGYQGDQERNARGDGGRLYHTGDVATATRRATSPTWVAPTTSSRPRDYKISPFELESVLIEHPAVAEAAVVRPRTPCASRCRRRTSRSHRATSPTPETAASILAHAREHLAPYLRVRRIEFFELPKTISGKIRRVELRTREDEWAEQDIGTEWREEMFPELRSGS